MQDCGPRAVSEAICPVTDNSTLLEWGVLDRYYAALQQAVAYGYTLTRLDTQACFCDGDLCTTARSSTARPAAVGNTTGVAVAYNDDVTTEPSGNDSNGQIHIGSPTRLVLSVISALVTFAVYRRQ